MDAVDLLIHQHRKMEALLDQTLEAQTADERRKLFRRAADHLSVHLASEEEIFYPAVKQKKTEDILLESLEEHLSLKRLLADLLDLGLSQQTFEPKLKVLSEQAEHHHQEEEEHLFPKVKQILDAQEREELGCRMEALQVRMLEQGEPREQLADQTAAAAPL